MIQPPSKTPRILDILGHTVYHERKMKRKEIWYKESHHLKKIYLDYIPDFCPKSDTFIV